MKWTTTRVIMAMMLLGIVLPIDTFALWPQGDAHSHSWQILSYAFTHSGVLHLFINLFAIWQFGRALERHVGWQNLALVFGAGLLAAADVHLMSHAAIPAAGASGAIFAVMFCYGVMHPDTVVIPFRVSMHTFCTVLAVFSLLCALTGTLGGVGHWAHLGGMFAGTICGWRMQR